MTSNGLAKKLIVAVLLRSNWSKKFSSGKAPLNFLAVMTWPRTNGNRKSRNPAVIVAIVMAQGKPVVRWTACRADWMVSVTYVLLVKLRTGWGRSWFTRWTWSELIRSVILNKWFWSCNGDSDGQRFGQSMECRSVGITPLEARLPRSMEGEREIFLLKAIPPRKVRQIWAILCFLPRRSFK